MKKTHWWHAPWVTVLAAFVLAFFTFGAVLSLPLVLQYRHTPSAEVSGMQGKERTVLVLVHDREGNLTGAVAVGTDTAAMQVSVTAYPQQTEVVYRTALYTLAECYRDGGISAAECLSAATGESYDAVLRLSTQALGSLASQVGGIPYVLSKPWGSLP